MRPFVLLARRKRKNGKIMLYERLICSELHHLRVYENEFKFRRMLGIQERRHYHIQSYGLALLCRSGNKEVRCISKVKNLDPLGNRISYGYRKLRLALTESGIIEHRLERHNGRRAVGHLNSDAIRQRHYTHPLGIQCHGYLPVQILN